MERTTTTTRYLTGSSPLAEQLRPEDTAVQLKLHQRAALHACMAMETSTGIALADASGSVRTRIGIMGDCVGAGKSYVVLSLVLATKRLPFDPTPIVRTFCKGRVMHTSGDVAPSDIATSVLVIPHSLCTQWESYAQQFSRALNTVSVNKAKHVDELRRIDLAEVDLVIVSSTFYSCVEPLFRGRRPRRVVYDEADTLHIPKRVRCDALHIDAAFMWFVTASYNNIMEPHLSSVRTTQVVRTLLADLSHVYARSVGRALVVRNEDAFVRSSMSLDEPDMVMVPCTTPHTIRVLDGIIDSHVIECLNAGDVAGALQHISPKNQHTAENITSVLVNKYVSEVRNLNVMISAIPAMENSAAPDIASSDLALKLLKKRSELEATIDSIRKRVTSCDMCCICYDSLSNKTVVPCCSNAYCFRCICQWLVNQSKTCPLCKADVQVSDLLVVDDSGRGGDGASRPATMERKNKLDTMGTIIRSRVADRAEDDNDSGGSPVKRKFLIFSSYDNSFVGITAVLDNLGMAHRYLRGNHDQIRSIVDSFKGGDLDVLLVNPKHYGSGLNFENTSDIIMFHRIDAELEKQVVGRAMRMGRTQRLKVWHLLHDNEAPGGS